MSCQSRDSFGDTLDRDQHDVNHVGSSPGSDASRMIMTPTMSGNHALVVVIVMCESNTCLFKAD